MLVRACLPVGVSASRPSEQSESGNMYVDIHLSVRPSIRPSIHTHPQLLPHLPVSVSTLKLHMFLLVLPFLIQSSEFSPAFPLCLYIPPRQQRNQLPQWMNSFVYSVHLPNPPAFLPGLCEPSPCHPLLRVSGTMPSMPGGEGKEDGEEGLSCFLNVFVCLFFFPNLVVF